MTDPTDYQLLGKWKAGDDDAGNELVRRHFSVVFRFFRGKIGGSVDDLTQRTFLACVESAHGYRGDGSFRGYLLAIARRQLFAHLRGRYREERVFDPATVSIQEVDDPGWVSPSGVVADQQSEQLLLLALRRIPIDFQITLELFYWEELPIKEIANVLEIAPGTVKSRLGRAREMLRAKLGEVASGPELAESTFGNLEHWAVALKERFVPE